MTPLVSMHQASLRIRDRVLFENITWEIHMGEHWAVVGPNGAGKSTLVRALTGDVPVIRGDISPSEPARLRRQAACLSFESQRKLIAQEDRREELYAFSGRSDKGARVGDVIRLAREGATRRPTTIWEQIQINPLLDRHIHELSSGEMRRFQIALALSTDPRVLILDEPYEGLDQEHRAELAKALNELMGPGRAVVLVTHRRSEIPLNVTHVMGVRAGRIVFQGRREDLLDARRMDSLYALPASLSRLPTTVDLPTQPDKTPSEVLIDLRNVTVKHGRSGTGNTGLFAVRMVPASPLCCAWW